MLFIVTAISKLKFDYNFNFAAGEFAEAQNLFQLLCQRTDLLDVSLYALSNEGAKVLIGDKAEMFAMYEEMQRKAREGNIGHVPLQ